MKFLKHIKFCLILLLIIPFTESNLLMAAVPKKKQTTNLKTNEQKILNALKNGKIQLVTATPQFNASKYAESLNSINKFDFNSLKTTKEKTFFETISFILSVISPLFAIFWFIHSVFFDKKPTREKLPTFYSLFKIFKSFISNMKVKRPPASFLANIADLLPKKHRESLMQEISDIRIEYNDALIEKKIWRARCIVSFYYIGIGWSVVMWISGKVKEIIGIIPKKY